MIFILAVKLNRIANYDIEVLPQQFDRLQPTAEIEYNPVLKLFERSDARIQPCRVRTKVRQLVFRPFNRVLHCVSLLSLLLFTLAR